MTGVVRSVAVRFSADVAGLVAGYRTVAAESDKLTAKQQSAVKGIGTVSGAVAIAAAAALGGTVMAAANFDSAMSDVQAATHESAAAMGELRQAALDAGADTVFSASEAAGGIENLAKAGVSTADILNGGLSGALNLAAAGGLAVADSAEIAATALTQFQLSGSDIPHVADLLAAAAGKAQGEVSDMGMALKQSGLVAAQMGLSIEETTGTLAAFASAGLIGSDAGTSFRTMLLRMANPSKEAADLMKKFGISAYDAQGNMVSMADLAGQLNVAFEGQTQATRDAAFATIFGSDAIRGANVLYNQGTQGIRYWTSAVNDQGYAAETAATKLDNLKGDLEALRGSLETAAIGTGDNGQAQLREWVQGLTDVVNAYNKLPDVAKGGVASLLGITAVTSGAVWFGSKAILGVSRMNQNLGQLDGTAAKAAGSLRALGVAAGAAMVLETVVSVAADLNREFDRAAPNVYLLQQQLSALKSGGSVEPLVTDLGDLQGAIQALGDPSVLQSALGGITDFYNKIPGGGLISNALEIAPVSSVQLRNMREAQASLDALDQALVGLAQSDGPKAARKAFTQLASSYHLTADEQERLLALLPTAGPLLADTGAGARTAGKGIESLLNPLQETETQFEQTTSAAKSFKVELEALNGLLDKRAALRNYQAALDDFQKSFKHIKGDDFNRALDPGRENEAKLDAIAESAGVVASHLGKVARVEFVKNVVGQLRTMAKNMDLPKGSVDDLIAGLRTLDTTKAEPPVRVDGVPGAHRDIDGVHSAFDVLDALGGGPTITAQDHASGTIDYVRAALAQLHDKTITITTLHNDTYGGLAGGGGHEPKKQYAAGGWPELNRAVWVGEEGPELAVFAQPAQIIPHRESMRMATADVRAARPSSASGAAGATTVMLPPGMKIGGVIHIPGIGRGELMGEVVADRDYQANRALMKSGSYAD